MDRPATQISFMEPLLPSSRIKAIEDKVLSLHKKAGELRGKLKPIVSVKQPTNK